MFGTKEENKSQGNFFILNYSHSKHQTNLSVKTFKTSDELINFICSNSVSNKEFIYTLIQEYQNGSLTEKIIVVKSRIDLVTKAEKPIFFKGE